MRAIDKQAMGARVREIREAAGLRQRELADLLGTTQSAIHKYERGVVPEPRRMIALAEVGETTIEWILTGRHWAGGSADRRRPADRVLALADSLCRNDDRTREAAIEAARILRSAGEPWPDSVPASDTAALIERALDVHRRVLQQALEGAWKRLGGPPVPDDEDAD